MNDLRTTLGSLTCHLIQASTDDTPPALAVVLCHGFGAPGDDLVPIGHELLARHPELALVRFAFPAAPIELGDLGFGEARAWWPLDVERLMAAHRQGAEAIRAMRREVPPGLSQARRQLLAFVDQLGRQSRLPLSRIILGGFSQGAMLATDVALHLEGRPAGLVIFSGTLLCEAEWRKRAALRAGLPVLQTHGRQDALLPFDSAEALRDLLKEAGLAVDFVPFEGGHTIPPAGLSRLAELIILTLPSPSGEG